MAELPQAGDVFVMQLTPTLRALARVLRRCPSPLPPSMHGRYGQTEAVAALCEPFVTDPDAKVELSSAAKVGKGVHPRWRGEPMIMMLVGFPNPPNVFTFLGRMPPSDAELRLERDDLGAWESFAAAALDEWEARATPPKKAPTRRTRRAIDVDALRKAVEQPLTQIDQKALASKARKILVETAKELETLGAAKGEARWAVIQKCVEAFNELDVAHEFIDTTVREELCERIAAIGEAAGLRDVDAAIDEWREW